MSGTQYSTKPNPLEKLARGIGDIGEGAIQLGLNTGSQVFPSLDPMTQRHQRDMDLIDQSWQMRRENTGDTGDELLRSVGRGIALSGPFMAIPKAAAGLLPALAEGLAQSSVSVGLSPTRNTQDYFGDKAAMLRKYALPIWPTFDTSASKK